ncbi:MAG TPA: RDD family protein [Acidimicrobiia bacterium]
MAPAGMYFDPASGLLLPNGVQLASIGRRIGAWFLAIPLAIVTLGIGYVIWGLIVWGRGQTPALQVLGMRCWRPETNRVATWGWMALREIIGRLVEGILSIITLLASFILMCAGKERKTIHDHIAGTVVLHDPNHVLMT